MSRKSHYYNDGQENLYTKCREWSKGRVVEILRMHSRSDSRARRRLCCRGTPPRGYGILHSNLQWDRRRGWTRIRAAERKLIIAAGQNWIRKLRRRTRTPRGAIITTSRCLVDTSKDHAASLAEPQYLVGLYVVNDIYILIEEEK